MFQIRLQNIYNFKKGKDSLTQYNRMVGLMETSSIEHLKEFDIKIIKWWPSPLLFDWIGLSKEGMKDEEMGWLYNHITLDQLQIFL